MKNVLNESDRAELRGRLEQLTPETEARWGTLTAPEMICHLKDWMALAVGERHAEPRGNLFMRTTLVPKILLYFVPFGKTKIETPKELDPKREGSRPDDFTDDKNELFELLDRFVQAPADDLAPHPDFGRLSKWDWGRAAWRNCNHHLDQFGL